MTWSRTTATRIHVVRTISLSATGILRSNESCTQICLTGKYLKKQMVHKIGHASSRHVCFINRSLLIYSIGIIPNIIHHILIGNQQVPIFQKNRLIPLHCHFQSSTTWLQALEQRLQSLSETKCSKSEGSPVLLRTLRLERLPAGSGEALQTTLQAVPPSVLAGSCTLIGQLHPDRATVP